MNPIFLSIEGLNSFYEKQDIDFVKLTRRKLFGIFGPTGSGKSTVLDGITLALYDQIARYDGRKGKEFIHMASEKCGVEFTFSLVEGGEEYTVFRSYKRYKDSYKTLQARFVKGGQVVAEGTMETNKAVLQVIGLGYEDFTRSVLLPQGKFSEFLLLTGAERSQMLERIFRLERYGSKFSGRLKGALSEQRLEENTVRTQILELGDIHPEQLVQLKTQWEAGTQEEIKLKEAVFQAREKLQYSIQQFALVQEKLSIAEKIKEWTRKKAAFDKKKIDLAYQKKAVEFIPLWEQFQQTKKYFDENRQKERKLTADLKALTKEYEEIKAKNEGVINKKQERYPVLLQQQQKIEQAVKIETEVKENESEREKLLQSYQQKQQFLKEKRNLLEALTQKRQAVDEKINVLQEQSQALFVSFENQQAASEKANLQKALQEQEIKGEELEKKLLAEQYEIKNAQLEIQQHQGQIQVQEEKLLSIQKQLESLGQEIDLLEEKLALFFSRMDEEKEAGYLNQKKEQLDEWKSKLTFLAKQMKKSKENLEKSLVSWETQNVLFLDLQQEEKNYVQQHALSLAAFALKDQQACPVCGSTHHPQPLAEMPPIEKISGKLAKVMEQRELLFKQVLKEQAEYAGQQSSQKLWTEQMEMIQTMLEEALKSSLDSPYQQLKQKKTARNHLINEMDNLDRQYRALLQEKAVLTERLRQKEEGLKERQKEFGQWQEQYRKNKDLLYEHKNKDGQTDYIKALALLHMNMQRREKVEKELSEKLADRERLQKEQDGCQQQLFQFQSELDLIKEKGTEKKSRIAQLKETLTILTDGQPVLLWKKHTEQELAKLLQEEETIGKLWQSIQERYRQCSEERQEMSGKVETFSQVLEKQQAGLLDECQKAGFSSIEEMRQYHVEKETLHAIEEEILAFEQEGAAIQARMVQLTQAVTGENITEEALEALKKDLAEKETALEELSRKVVLLKNNHDNLQQSLEKLKDYQGRQSKIKEKKEMLDDLAKLTQGNAFVHYIANKQLLYVAQEATNRLKYMTHGRYAIEIENGEFYIQDDFNGGVTRSVRTLSGGEIFITSFALALALSDRIQMKNNVPIQTFFLDEGFGSLDPGMLDVVMDSLESLYDENLKVGVISHVEELKNRIPVRLEIQHHKESFAGAKAVL